MPLTRFDLDDATMMTLRSLLVSRQVSAVEVAEAVLDRINATDRFIHAYVHVLGDEALDAARRADQELARGSRKPLLGIPFAAKDVFRTKGSPTEAGSDLLRGYRPSRDAAAVRLLREAGAVLVGKHVTPEFTVDPTITAARNAWELSHYSGGSSAGAGNSVAVGSSLLALGTDAGGSVRKPAALNGVVGLKPTRGLISRAGIIRPASSLDTVGVVTRTVADCWAALRILASDTRDVAHPTASSRQRQLLPRPRIGLPRSFFGERLDTTVREAVEKALEEIRRHGGQLVRVEIPALDAATSAGIAIVAAETGRSHMRCLRSHPDEYSDATRRALEAGLLISPKSLGEAVEVQERISWEINQTFQTHRLDALAGPTLPRPSVPVEELTPANYPHEYVIYTIPANLAGLPALSVPCGLTGAGLPVGLQLIGTAFSEEKLFAIAADYEAVTPWHTLRPRLLDLLAAK